MVTGHYYERNLPQPNAHNLERNFRCTAPVVRLSAAILARLRAIGVSDLEWPCEDLQIEGRVPVLTPPTSEVLADMRTPCSRMRVILVADDDTKTRLEAETESMVFTVSEAKGMEWEQVSLVSFGRKIASARLHSSAGADELPFSRSSKTPCVTVYVAVARALDTVTIVAEPHKHSLWSHPECAAMLRHRKCPCRHCANRRTCTDCARRQLPQTAAKPASAVEVLNARRQKPRLQQRLAQPVHTGATHTSRVTRQ